MNKHKNWYFFFILIPLLPFLISGIVKFITILGAGTDYSQFGFFVGLESFLVSWDPIKLAFATAMMSFFIKVDLVNHERLMDNEDKRTEVSERCTMLFIYGVISFCVIGLLILIDTLKVECGYSKLSNLQIIFNCLSLLLAFAIINYGVSLKKEFKLECKNLI